ncbi:MAG: hypothetical protein RSG52_12730 [Terrisporobacter sp.]|uniref:hypothetical protein n=1 Tax=Terrisporobacter sp. TaxID=1965305 RepID=UPI002FCB4640
MIEILKEIDIDIDIKRCEDVIRENNYLEIVIAIEEISDKYRNKISHMSENENNVVWNYNRKNLEEIEKHLISYKEELILKEKERTIAEKLANIKVYIEENNVKNKNIILENIDFMEEINNKDITLDEKWMELKKSLDLIKSFSREISIYILEIIILIAK